MENIDENGINEETTVFLPEKPQKVGRPVKQGSGVMIISCSIPYGYKDLMIKYGISPSNALKEGILMLLNDNPQFPQDEYESMQMKGHYVEKRKQFAQMLSKVV